MDELHHQFGEPAQEWLQGFGFGWEIVGGPGFLALDRVGRVVGCLM